MITVIGTHDGLFHADEVLAIALLEVFVGNFRVIRSRDPEILDKAQLLIDVGEKYEPKIEIINYDPKSDEMFLFVEGSYDHHHLDEADCLYGNSSVGLVWKDLNKMYKYHNDDGGELGEVSIAKKRYPSIDKLVQEVSAQDIGVQRHGDFHLCNLVVKMNAEDPYSEDQVGAFHRALKFAVTTVKDLIRLDEKVEQQLESLKEVKMIEVLDYKIAFFSKNSLWVSPHLLIDKADIHVFYDSNQSCWSVMMVPLKQGGFLSKYSLESSKSEDEIFVHKNGFIGKYKSNHQDIIQFKIKGKEKIDLNIRNE